MIEHLLSTDYLLRDRAAWKRQAELANDRADRFRVAFDMAKEALFEARRQLVTLGGDKVKGGDQIQAAVLTMIDDAMKEPLP